MNARSAKGQRPRRRCCRAGGELDAAAASASIAPSGAPPAPPPASLPSPQQRHRCQLTLRHRRQRRSLRSCAHCHLRGGCCSKLHRSSHLRAAGRAAAIWQPDRQRCVCVRVAIGNVYYGTRVWAISERECRTELCVVGVTSALVYLCEPSNDRYLHPTHAALSTTA